jgi:hypothetical protein
MNFLGCRKDKVVPFNLESSSRKIELGQVPSHLIECENPRLYLDFSRAVLSKEFLHNWAEVESLLPVSSLDHLVSSIILLFDLSVQYAHVKLCTLWASPQVEDIRSRAGLLTDLVNDLSDVDCS